MANARVNLFFFSAWWADGKHAKYQWFGVSCTLYLVVNYPRIVLVGETTLVISLGFLWGPSTQKYLGWTHQHDSWDEAPSSYLTICFGKTSFFIGKKPGKTHRTKSHGLQPQFARGTTIEPGHGFQPQFAMLKIEGNIYGWLWGL